MKRTSILLVLFLLMQGMYTPGFSQNDRKSDKTESPYFFVKTENTGADPLPLVSTEAIVDIAGVIAHVKIIQQYKNNGTKALEAVYVFPASTRAALHSMKIRIGERSIEAKIQEKEKARNEYQAALTNGQTAALLEQQRPNVFQMNVGNIHPGDQLMVEMEYTELLIPEEGIYSFVFPTVVGPRYSNPTGALASTDNQWVSNPYTPEGEKPLYTFHLDCQLRAGMPIQDVKCTSHSVDISYQAKDEVWASLKESGKYGGNKDFILQYRLSGEKIHTGLLLFEKGEEHYFLAMVQPPAQVTPAQVPAREYLFVVDVSGSMTGFPLEISKKLMKDLISGLRPEDRFNILTFAGGNTLMSPAALNASPANIRTAEQFLQNLNGGGGTELLPALQRILLQPEDEHICRTIVIATDGYVTVEKEAFRLIRDNLNRSNFFAFGIGSSVNRYLIEGIAHAGSGEAFIATNQQDAQEMAARFRRYISMPVLSHIQVNFKGFNAYDVVPGEIPDVFAGRPLLVFGKYRGKAGGTVAFTGLAGSGEFSEQLDAGMALCSRENEALPYLWAREKIRLLDDFGSKGKSDAEVAKEVCALGLNYHLLTKYTSFLAVDSEKRNTSGQVQQVIQPLPLPEGVSNQAVGAGQLVNSTATGNNGGSGGTMRKSGKENQTYPQSGTKIKVPAVVTVEEKTETDKTTVADSAERPLFCVVEEMPSFPGGEAALKEFLRKHLVYPEAAKKAHITGKVYVRFRVEKDGRLTNIRVLRGIGSGCDEEAIRLVKLMPRWKPGEHAGKVTEAEYTIGILF